MQAAAQALDRELQAVTAAIPLTVLFARIDVLPEEVLDVLAWQLHVDFYEPVGFSIEKKRALIKQSIAWHRHKGTPWAVEQVVSAAFANAEVVEWFDYDGDPYRFKIRTIDSLTDDAAYSGLVRAINTVKNTRSWLDGIQIKREISIGGEGQKSLYFGFLSGQGGKKTIGLPLPRQANISRNIGIASRKGGQIQINISRPSIAPTTLFAGVFMRRGGTITIGRRSSGTV
ncbi:MAG TPA: phage tail protein I [Methylomusa anaerophila]|uniref:phage tail protein I n=1 Tax=Methylomusa anaerophila TaxID=1930071 RepID=UPI0013154801|nr:phage tail protein I [Methylomusa anaerophila]HML88940.1 phage tail protein I [Methylomusa anaerophila]